MARNKVEEPSIYVCQPCAHCELVRVVDDADRRPLRGIVLTETPFDGACFKEERRSWHFCDRACLIGWLRSR